MDIDTHLQIDTDLTTTLLTEFIQNGVTKAGFKRAVLGISGGIDSALSATLTARALGPENVLGVRMPYATSSPDSLSDAQQVIDALGINSLTVAITPFVQPMFDQFPEMSPVRQGNVMARMRMIILYDQSAAFNGLVMGTSNKTETLLGYSTIYGDNAAALQPIADLYKAQVRQLSSALGVPQNILDKPPSADLWAGQTDEDEIGYSYHDLDQLLYLLVDKRFRPEEAVAEGFDAPMVEDVWQRVQTTHYKRVMPPVARIQPPHWQQ